MQNQTPAYRQTTLVSFFGILLLALVVTSVMVLPYLLAVIMGGILAILFGNWFQACMGFGMGRRVSATLVTLAVALLVIVPLILFFNMAINQGISLSKELAENQLFSFDSVLNQVNQFGTIQTFMGSPEAVEVQVHKWIQLAGKQVGSSVLSIVENIPSILLQVILCVVSFCFFLIDGKDFQVWASNKIPLDEDVRKLVVTTFANTATSVIWASFSAAGAQSLIMFISFLLLGVPLVFFATVATFVFAWIPLVGSSPVWLVGALYLYSKGLIAKAIFLIVVGLGVGVVDNIVRAWVLKGRGAMHPLVSLVAIFGGIGMFGLMGIFVGPILLAILIALLQIWPTIGHRFGLLPNFKA